MKQPFANITKMVYDFLVVEISEPAFVNQDHYFDYSIFSQDEKPLRKGRFFGSKVQLRMSQMAEGNYLLRLFLDGEFFDNISFEKKSSALAF